MTLAGTDLAEGAVVPAVRFVDPASGRPVELSSFRQRWIVVLAFLHDGCADCRSFAERLAAVGADLDWAQAIVRVILRDDAELPVPVLVDQEGTATTALIGEAELPVVLIVDRYGAAAAAYPAPEHRFPAAGEISATATHLAIQCPECGISHWPDEGPDEGPEEG